MEMQRLQMEAQVQPTQDAMNQQEKQMRLALERDRLELEKQRLQYQASKDHMVLQQKDRHQKDKTMVDLVKADPLRIRKKKNEA
jgi:hypothetical protein